MTVPPQVTVVGNIYVLALVGGLTDIEFQISEASPEVSIDDINLLFDNGVDVMDVAFQDIVDGNNLLTVRYSLVGVRNEDEGNYTLIARNPAGGGEATIAIQVQGKYYKRDLPKIITLCK